MNITFLIGNGFDLNCGLKTSYRDVYKEYCSTQSDDKLIQRFKQQILEDEETWSDFEVAMSQKMGEFESETDFLRCLRDFKKFLEKYLLRQEKEFDAIVSAGGKQLSDRVKQELGTSIDSFYKGITHDLTNRLGKQFFNAKLSFVSFNYTAILDKILLHHSGNSNWGHNVIHIHGVLDDDLILGMDNESQFPLQCFPYTTRTKRAFLKPFFNDEYDSERVRKAWTTISNADIICVFGMSLGISDLSWRSLLLKALDSEPHTEVFVFIHELSNISDVTIDERMDLEEDAKRKLLYSWGINQEDAEQYLPNLHIPCGKMIFNFKDAIEKGIKAQKQDEIKGQQTLKKLQECLAELESDVS